MTVCWQFKDGLKNLRGISSIHMTCDDFDQLTENGMLLTDGQFNSAQFRDMMKGVCVCVSVCVCVCVCLCVCHTHGRLDRYCGCAYVHTRRGICTHTTWLILGA